MLAIGVAREAATTRIEGTNTVSMQYVCLMAQLTIQIYALFFVMQCTVATKLELSAYTFENCKYFMINAASDFQIVVVVFELYVFIIT
jgi:hypothetical protein